MFAKVRLISFALVLGVLFSISACGARNMNLTQADNGSQVTVASGQKLVISLPGNPSTGYNWEVDQVDESILQLAGEPVFESDKPGLPGAGGMLTLNFNALSAGTTTLILVYHRSWEVGIEPLDTFTVTVTVK
jgi:inhibitor of cysteine peptidase